MSLCFISYARNSNLDGHLGKFVDKLKKQLPGHLPHGVNTTDIVFFDRTSIETSDRWMNVLAEATRSCSVCVCFYSLPYFTSEYGGREVHVFLERIRAWEQQPANTGMQARAIIPVLWVPYDPIPRVLRAFQLPSAELPDVYVRDGLHSLALRKAGSGAYNTVLDKLAREIAAIVQRVQLPLGPPIPAFNAIASAFHTEPTPVRYGAAVLLLADAQRRARPFAAGGGSLDALLEAVATRANIPTREVDLTADPKTAIEASIAAREMPVVIADGETLAANINAPLVKQIVAALNESATVVVFGDPVPNATASADRLSGIAATKLTPWVGANATSCIIATDPTTLSAELEKQLSRAKHALVAADPAARAEHVGLQGIAAAQGIAVATQPVLTGPGA